MNSFETAAGGPLIAGPSEILQINVGLKCDLACSHCHLEAGPARREVMDRPTMAAVIRAAERLRPRWLDITGGAPELNPDLPWLLQTAAGLDLPMQVRTNLTALFQPGLDKYFDLYTQLKIALAVSLPCYLEKNVRPMRGAGAYKKIIAAIKQLNAAGYGHSGGPRLDLIFNHPLGPYLPPAQKSLENDYRNHLAANHGVVFSNLLVITNMPLGRYGRFLQSHHLYDQYRNLLKNSFNPATLASLMCRRQITIGWDGRLYDCDFNLALGLRVNHGVPERIQDFAPDILNGRVIVTGDHCFGCTAGAGSSCAGAIVREFPPDVMNLACRIS